MMLGFFCLNFMITFFLTWFPSYLVEERGFNMLKLGVFGMIPPLAAILGSWAGGIVGDHLLARGWSLNKVRKTCLVGGMMVCSVIALAAVAPEAWQALVLMSISYAAAAFTIVSIWCLPADVVDSSTVATLGSTQNFFSNIGSALSPIVIGALYGATGSFQVPLLLTAAIIVAGGIVLRIVDQEGRAHPASRAEGGHHGLTASRWTATPPPLRRGAYAVPVNRRSELPTVGSAGW